MIMYSSFLNGPELFNYLTMFIHNSFIISFILYHTVTQPI